MAKSEESEITANPQHALEVLQQAQAKLDKTLESLPPAIQEITSATDKHEPQAADLADNAEIQHVEQQLRAMLTKADAIEAEATRLESESSGGTGSTEASQALSQASAMRGAAKDAQGIIDSAKAGKKRISSAKLEGISKIIANINNAADNETADLNVAFVAVRSDNAKRATKPAASKSSVVARVLGVASGSHALGGGAGQQHGRRNVRDDDDDDHFISTVSGSNELYTVRKVRGQGADRSLVNGLSLALGERYADETVATVKTGASKVWNGYVAINTGNREAADRAALETARGIKNVIHDVGIDDIAANVTNAIGLNKAAEVLTGNANIGGTVSQNVGRAAHNTLWLGGRIGSAPMYYAKQAGAAISEYIWGASAPNDSNAKAHPEKKPAHSPKGAMVTLDGFGRMTIEDAKTTLLRNNIKIDKDTNGIITYGEAFAAVKQWNATHAPNGQPLVPSASPNHATPHGPAQRPHK